MNEEQKEKFDKEMTNLIENLDKTFMRMMTVSKSKFFNKLKFNKISFTERNAFMRCKLLP